MTTMLRLLPLLFLLLAAPAHAALGNALGAQQEEEEFLDPEQAFAFSAETEGNEVVARWFIAPGYYLYRDKIKVKLLQPETGVTLGELVLPAGDEKEDEFFGRIRVFHNEVEAHVPATVAEGGYAWIKVEFAYQGCAEAGLCYPPMKKSVELALGATAGGIPSGAVAVAAAPPAETSPAGTADKRLAAGEPLSEQDAIARDLAQESTALVIASFFGFGLLLAFTPCVFPMIPILSSIIVGQGKGLTTSRAFLLSTVYVLAMAATYTVAGVLAGLFGANLQAAFQNPWIITAFATVFVALALSMFGFYDLQLPSSWQGKLAEISNRQQGGTLLGVAVMGLLSALIVGPCVAAPLAGALIYIGQSGDALLGGTALFALSLGMGLPLILIGTAGGKLLPRAGMWMDGVKAVFGVMLLGIAIYFMERILPPAATMLLWALLTLTSAVYMGALEPIREGGSGWRKLWKGLGVALLLYGALLLIGAGSGGSDPLRPLEGVRGMVGSASAEPRHLAFKTIKGVDELNRELAAAKGRPVMLDFYADWCVYCKQYDKYTFSDPRVVAALGDTVLLKADVTANDDLDQALMKHLGVTAPPSIHFFDREGREIRAANLVGFMEAEGFMAHFRRFF